MFDNGSNIHYINDTHETEGKMKPLRMTSVGQWPWPSPDTINIRYVPNEWMDYKVRTNHDDNHLTSRAFRNDMGGRTIVYEVPGFTRDDITASLNDYEGYIQIEGKINASAGIKDSFNVKVIMTSNEMFDSIKVEHGLMTVTMSVKDLDKSVVPITID